MKDNIFSGPEVREKLAQGIFKVSSAVGGTMGSAGYNGLIEAIERPGYDLTNDGITIAEAIQLADPIEDMGRKILVEAISRANKQSGDGSSTTCVLTAAIIEEGMKYLDKISPMEMKNSLESCVKIIEDSVDKQKKQITVKEVGQVASISAEDPKIGSMIEQIYKQIGKEGIIHWDISKTFEDHYTIGKGITVEGAGFVSPYMADLDEKTGSFLNVARWNKPKILITTQKITSAADFNDLFQALFNQNIKEVVVFCDEYEANVIPDLIKTRAVRGFKTLLVKMPVLWKDWWYEDLAKATGATIVDPVLGLSFKNMKLEHLGTVEHITVDKENTYLDGIEDVSEHIKKLEEDGSDDSKIRVSRLNTKTARYFVGAQSESALSHRRYKVEDAISASWQALHGGVCLGGGVALVKASVSLDNEILKKALCAPHEQIKGNMGKSFSEKDMEEQNVYDPANIVLNAVRNAISVAASILTASVVVLYPRPEIAEQLVQSIMSKNMSQ